MSLLEILILAVVQGVTEFLPVSSSGHLIVANALLQAWGYPKAPDLLSVNIVLHLGTLLAILIFYWREILRLVGADRRVIPLLIVGTLPAAIVGLPLKKYYQELLESPLLAGFMFPVTAAILVWASRRPEGTTLYTQLSYPRTLLIGLFQAFALLPGISRSGSTIAGGLGVGLDRRSAGTFAFLLAIPAIGGAGALEVRELLQESATQATHVPTLYLLLGAAVSCVVGFGALTLLIRWVQRGRLGIFAWYLVPLGAAVVAWQLSR